MSGHQNGRPIVNGCGMDDDGHRILVTHRTPIDDMEPLGAVCTLTDVERAALRAFSGQDERTYGEIASEIGCTRSGICAAVKRIAKAFELRMPREGRRAALSRAAMGHPRTRFSKARGAPKVEPSAPPTHIAVPSHRNPSKEAGAVNSCKPGRAR